MSRKSPKKDEVRRAKPAYSKKIITLLSEKPALSLASLVKQAAKEGATIPPYALTRSLHRLHDAGLVEYHHSGQQEYARLTKEGRRKAHSLKLDTDTALINPAWDGKWRIIILDIPESRKTERDGLRYLLKKAGFVCLKNSVWISLQPFEHMFMNIKRDLGLTTELMIFVTDTIDRTTEEAFLKLAK
jgi:DNA-binding transcriptional regulator PaaX